MVAIDINGGIVERYEYDAYGSVNTYNADYSQQYAASQINNPYAFTGRRLDVLDGGGLERMHYRHRDYSMAMGRFMQQDPLEYIDSLGLYEYVTGKPTISADPEGKGYLEIILAVGGLIVFTVALVDAHYSNCHAGDPPKVEQAYVSCSIKCPCDRTAYGVKLKQVVFKCVKKFWYFRRWQFYYSEIVVPCNAKCD